MTNPIDDVLARAQFGPDALIPAVIQDADTREILTLAYMNEEALRRTLQNGEVHLWSRSRQQPWHKGETSGNFQKVRQVRLDCDFDTVLVEVEPQGPACHTGAYSCFGVEPGFDRSIQQLYDLIERRKKERPEGSYTTRLFNEGIDKIVKKLGEEAVETVIAAKNDSSERIVEETADLLYHLMVTLVEKGVTLEEVGQELGRRETRRKEKLMQPDIAEIHRLREHGNVIPVYKSVIADFLTPVSAFLRLEKDRPYAFLLESVEGGETIARYSFLGCDPFLICRYRQGQPADFMENLRATLKRFRSVKVPNLPPFTGGAVGYFGYGMVRTIENIPDSGIDDLGVDDAVLMFYKTVLAFDHLRHQIHIISNLLVDESSESLEQQYAQATEEIRRIENVLRAPLEVPPTTSNRDEITVQSNFKKPDYVQAVSVAKEHIAAGDIFQVVVSQRFEVALKSTPFDIYRALRVVNPSPYMYFLKMPEFNIVGSSPEMLVKIQDREVFYRPIAGTRPRGRDDAEDEVLARELAADEKERAEHIMLVDLGRNDLGRVCRYGTVRVEELMVVERYSHVMHLVSALRGQLRDDVDRLDTMMACFPAGTVSGAPKVRAMEIIDQLEPTRRGVYSGAVMYVDFSNNLDSCIALRTMIVRDNKGFIQAGGGIVADSIPENEFQETVNKSRALLRAIQLAQQGFEM